MNNDIIIEQGVANEFKSNMQKTYDFLTDCNSSLESCSILEELGFDGGNTKAYGSSISTTKSEITSLLSIVMNCEEDLINLDESGSERLGTVFENDDEEKSTETKDKEEDTKTPEKEDDSDETTSGQSDSHHYSGPTYTPPAYTPPDVPQEDPQPEEVYHFSTDHDTAYNLGDIFIDDYDNSLTKFTNDLLEKYGIKDEALAKKIYEEVIKYGNDYYNTNNKNPLASETYETIMDALYEKLGYLVSDSTKDTFWDSLKDITL